MLRDLTDEICRIVLSPYPVSLKKLFDITSLVEDSTIQQWAEGHQCQVDALASAILEALQLWPFALDLLQRFSLIVKFRNAVLSQQPLLLNELLRKAIDPHHGTQRYFLPCVALLSAPLPHGVPYPASMPEFFLKAIEHAAQKPSATTIRPIYALLVGSCNGLLTVLPPQTVARFQDQLIKVLKNLENHSVNLLCLATFAAIIKSQKEASLPTSGTSSWISSPDSCSSAEHESQFEPIQQFFTPKKAPKIMHLIMLRVIFACSGSGNLTSIEALESVRLAKEIIDAVEPSLRDIWLQSNAPLTRKLQEKVLRSGIALDLKVKALDFISSLLGGTSAPPDIVGLFKDILSENVHGTDGIFSLGRLSMATKLKFLASVDETCITQLLRRALKAAVRQEFPSIKLLADLNTTESLIRGLTEAMQKSSKIRQSILCAVATNEFSVPLKDFLEIRGMDVKGTCLDYSICPAACTDARRRMCLAISALLIKTALYSSADNISIETPLAVSLYDRQQALAASTSICNCRYPHHSEKTLESLQLIEQNSTPSTQRSSHRWKERLSLDLSKEAASRNEIILRTVGEVCRDLEDRCETVERPLNVEKARGEQLTVRNVELEAEAAERGHFLSGLEMEKSRLESQVQTAELEADELLQRCQDLEAQVLQACQDTKNTTVSARDEIKQLQLEHLASISGKDDLLDEQRDQIKQTEKESAELRADLELANLSSNRKGTEIDELHNVETTLRAEVAALSLNLEVTKQAAASLEAKQYESEERLKKDLETLVRDHEFKLVELVEQTTQTCLNHQRELHELEQQCQDTTEKSNTERQRYESKISELEQTVAELRSEIKQKTKEFMEVQDLSRRLVAIMGHDTASGRQHKDSTGASVNNPTSTGSFGSSTSSQSGSTPKRPKTRKAPKTPSMNHTKAGGGTRTCKVARGNSIGDKRIPLKDLDNVSSYQPPILINRNPRDIIGNRKASPIFEIDNEVQAEEDLMEADSLSFSDSDFLTSTQKVSLERHTNEGCDDETTVDV